MTRRRRLPGRQGRPVAAAPGRRGGADAQHVADGRHRRAEAVDDPVTGPHRCRICPRAQTNWRADSQREAQRVPRFRSLHGLDVNFHKFAQPHRRPARPSRSGRRTRRPGARAGLVVRRHSSARWSSARPPTGCCTPRRYRSRSARAATGAPKSGRLTRITCAYSGTPESVHVVERVAALAERARCADAGGHLRDPGPHDVSRPKWGCSAEDSILEHAGGAAARDARRS